ncbi:hypothetical protein BGZ79_005284, partial [Entomortierella chlamydospora]
GDQDADTTTCHALETSMRVMAKIENFRSLIKNIYLRSPGSSRPSTIKDGDEAPTNALLLPFRLSPSNKVTSCK